MKQLRWHQIAAATVALVVSAACGGDDDRTPMEVVAVPGTLVLSLTTPNSDDGAVMFSISGEGITGLTRESPSHVVYFRSAGTVSGNAVVAGDITAGALARFNVPDVAAVSSYSATITEVAARDNTLRGSVTGYSLSISPAEGS